MEPDELAGDPGGVDDATELDSSDSGESAAEYDLGDALAEARAELGQEDSAEGEGLTAEGDSSDSPEQPEAEAQPEPTEKPAKGWTDQGGYHRLLTYAQQNRIGELPPEAQGVANALREHWIAELKQSEAEETQFRDMYLGLAAEKTEDPEAFSQRLLDNPDYAAFYKAYASAHPDVTAENPYPSARAPDPEEIRANVTVEWRQGFETTIGAVAADAGIDQATYGRLQGQAQGVGTLMASVITEATKAQIAKALPTIKRAEREAAEKEAQARFASRRIVTPRSLGTSYRPSGTEKSGREYLFEDAFNDAKAEAEMAR